MPEMTRYEPGTPSWTDLASPDVEASIRFYSALFGWEAFSPGPAEETGGYRIFTLRGKSVAAVGPLQNDGQPPVWTTYISTDDADGVAARAREAGGQVFVAPFDVMKAGRMTVIADPTGAVFGVWQPGETTGAQLVNEPGAMTWNELGTRDMEAAKRFYKAVFGWEGVTGTQGPMEYTEFKLDGRTIGGGMVLGEQIPASVPPYWATYFAVEDCDASVAKATELGAGTLVEPMSIPAGRFAHLQDPHGASFAVIAMTGAT